MINFGLIKKDSKFADRESQISQNRRFELNDKSVGALAQLVEQWTENPCVPGSIPGGTTKTSAKAGVFLCNNTAFRFGLA